MKCEQCSITIAPTIDHIIPTWAFKRRELLLGKKAKKYKINQKQTLCANCNFKKGGSIDVSHPYALSFWLDVREEINRAVNNQFS